ncbi:predicted protein [Aspergillus terreus NIH2624]|uniref:Uncharacterized protein n=1 Tax=Aspergillus terreus (strain NIH 2624 / FGSC A1156) TaxID=341663 RepID=Q0C7Z7_ASPTN|nr:uncharacterized protein ATEG_10187 [Aspergillus terreus NIH2624]EAU29636.1 predicted protein [Aspergillus terreus NIH2624]
MQIQLLISVLALSTSVFGLCVKDQADCPEGVGFYEPGVSSVMDKVWSWMIMDENTSVSPIELRSLNALVRCKAESVSTPTLLGVAACGVTHNVLLSFYASNLRGFFDATSMGHSLGILSGQPCERILGMLLLSTICI